MNPYILSSGGIIEARLSLQPMDSFPVKPGGDAKNDCACSIPVGPAVQPVQQIPNLTDGSPPLLKDEQAGVVPK